MVKHTVSEPQASSQPQPAASSSAPPADTSDVIDWDLVIETPPHRRSGTIRASLVHTGRSRALPVNEAGISMEGANGGVSKRSTSLRRSLVFSCELVYRSTFRLFGKLVAHLP